MADFAKYEDNFPADILKDIFDSVVDQAGGKFVYSKAGGSTHYMIKKGLDLLISAGIVIPVEVKAGTKEGQVRKFGGRIQWLREIFLICKKVGAALFNPWTGEFFNM